MNLGFLFYLGQIVANAGVALLAIGVALARHSILEPAGKRELETVLPMVSMFALLAGILMQLLDLLGVWKIPL